VVTIPTADSALHRLMHNIARIDQLPTSTSYKSINMAPIDLALEYLHSLNPEEKINYTQIAKKFGVDRSTLSRRYRQVNGSKEDKYYAQALLNKEQSAVLITLVNELAKHGVPLTNAKLAEFAKVVTGKDPGKNWASRWVKAHSDKLINVQQQEDGEEEEEREDEGESKEKEDEK
jgi:hypothetical protein